MVVRDKRLPLTRTITSAVESALGAGRDADPGLDLECCNRASGSLCICVTGDTSPGILTVSAVLDGSADLSPLT